MGDKSFETLITMGSFKESKFKLTCCAGQGLITIEVVMQKLKKVENFDCGYLFSWVNINFVH